MGPGVGFLKLPSNQISNHYSMLLEIENKKETSGLCGSLG